MRRKYYPLVWYLTLLFRRLRLSEYSPTFTEPEANSCYSIIFRGEYQELQNNGLHVKEHKTHNKLTCTLIMNQFTHRARL